MCADHLDNSLLIKMAAMASEGHLAGGVSESSTDEALEHKDNTQLLHLLDDTT